MSFAQCAQCISECLGSTETHKDLRCLKKQGQVQRGCLHVEEFPHSPYWSRFVWHPSCGHSRLLSSLLQWQDAGAFH